MSEERDISALRNEYDKFSLVPEQLPGNPIATFRDWFHYAVESRCKEVNAMVLSTVNSESKPSSRVVLLKGFDDNGFVFFTNYNSRKGHDLYNNPFAALNFFWPELERQVRIEGTVSKVSDQESTEYFNSRPRLSQAGAIVSHQSEEISDRSAIEKAMEEMMSKPESEILSKPAHWGGYVLKPDFMEFWQGRPGRLHDRICYEWTHEQWRKFRLSP
jgi:pyridoxamine 5'-phosphate oxidase